jgi:hypothetical protein
MGAHGLSGAFTVDALYNAFAFSAFMLCEGQRKSSLGATIGALRCSAGLCRDVNVFDLTPGLGDRQTAFPHTFVKLDSFPDFGFGLL